MSGSDQGVDTELGTMRSYLNGLAEDGVIYSPMEDLGKPKGSCFPDNIGFVAFAMANWYERDGNPKWLEYLDTLCRGFEKMAIKVEDRAFYPPEYCYMPDGSWAPEKRGDIKPFDGKEPADDHQGYEGAVKYYHAAPLQAFVKSYQYSGNQKNRDMAWRLTRFMMKPGLWRDTTPEGYNGVERGIFGGHFHGNLIPLWAMLNLAQSTGDQALKELVRSGYEHARRYIVPNVGWSPCYMYPSDFGTYHKYPFCDSCNVADTALLAVKLTDAGLGDFWDDAEGCARNQLAENQFLDKDGMRKFLNSGSQYDKEIDLYWGGFFQTEPTNLYTREAPHIPGCCIGSGPWGLYSVWHGITRFDQGVATVNMFLNRASDWMDIDSYLPYEGKVVMKNKKAHTALVRIPGWLKMEDVKRFVNDKEASAAVVDNRLVFSGLKSGDTIRLEFPVKERVQKHWINGIEHTLTFRGLTLVDIQPRTTGEGIYPTYQREHLKATKAPMHQVKRFVAEKLIPIP